MTYKGRVKNGVIVVDPPAVLPEGTVVEIVRLDGDLVTEETGARPAEHKIPRNLYEALGDLVGSFEGLPDDASENVDTTCTAHQRDDWCLRGHLLLRCAARPQR